MSYKWELQLERLTQDSRIPLISATGSTRMGNLATVELD